MPAPRTEIKVMKKAVKGYIKSYDIGVNSDKSALEELQNTRLVVSRSFIDVLDKMKGFKFVETRQVFH